MNKWQYYGLFLDKDTRNKLISFIQNSKWDYLFEETSEVYLDHCTLLHQSNFKEDSYRSTCIKNWLDTLFKFGMVYTNLLISHIGYSDKALAFKVILQSADFLKYRTCYNEIPHITIGAFKDGKPVDSNNIMNWYDLDEPIKIKATLKRV